MKSYLDIVKKVLAEGVRKHNRTGVDALTVPFVHFQHEMAKGFPLLTTKKMATKAIFVELEGFLRGITDKKWYQERGCKIWDEWANPTKVQERIDTINEAPESWDLAPPDKKEIQEDEDDLGPIYGYQWRKFGQQYGQVEGHPAGYEWCDKPNGIILGSDQLKRIVDTLRTNPYDRRMVCSAWNPNQIPMMALPPCHLLWDVVVIEGVLHLGWFQRSCDLMLGVPFNIASYATLMLLLCKHSGLQPGTLNGILADCHIYVNHIEGAKEQLLREPRNLPTLEITTDPFDLIGHDLVKWTYKDIQLLGYNPQEKINFEVAV